MAEGQGQEIMKYLPCLHVYMTCPSHFYLNVYVLFIYTDILPNLQGIFIAMTNMSVKIDLIRKNKIAAIADCSKSLACSLL